jgi:hypothetical protein
MTPQLKEDNKPCIILPPKSDELAPALIIQSTHMQIIAQD